MKTIQLTMAQALLKFMANQYVELDNKEYPFIRGVFGIFGHGNVTGIGEALEYQSSGLTYYRASNEQSMVHAATAFAKQSNRLQIFACTSSIGPGATNMITGAAAATTNRIPVLLLPGDIFACRQPDPVLQQLEDPIDYTMSVNDCFKPVSKYWDRISRPEQLMSACLNAFRVLTDPVDTGAVTLCLPQDVQCESYDYPENFFHKRVWHIDRRILSERAIAEAATKIQQAKQPLIIAGGGVHYSLACDALVDFAETLGIPVAETQAGKSTIAWDHPLSVGGVGVTGTEVANKLAAEADVILAVGSRLQDFTTASKLAFQHPQLEILHLNVNAFDGYKLGASYLPGDAKLGLQAIKKAAQGYRTTTDYQNKITKLREAWNHEVDKLYIAEINNANTQTAVLGAINEFVSHDDTIVCAAGSLPGDLHRLWRCQSPKDYHIEYAYSCMGYEVAAGLGVRFAKDQGEVYVIVGDGSFLMLHSALLTSLQERQKINVILLDNNGFQCIKNLQESVGSQGFGNELRYRDPKSNRLEGEIVPVDFAKYAEALGAKTYFAKDIEALKQALQEAKQSPISTLIEIKVAPRTMSEGYESWWRVGVADVSEAKSVNKAYKLMCSNIEKVRRY